MKSIVALFFSLVFSYSVAQTVSNVAGIPGAVGSANGPAASSTFNNPHGIACDPQGNIYIANRYGHTIRKITPAGIVSVFAGSGSIGATDGQGTLASFNEPWAVACDTLGNVYVADTKNYKIRMITASGNVTTVAGTGTFGVTNGLASVAQFGFPSGLAVNKAGTIIYVVDRMTHTIRKITGGNVTTIAGVVYSPGDMDGNGVNAMFDHPYSIAMESTGNVVVADEYNNKIKRVTPNGDVTTIAGTGFMGNSDGPALSATFNAPWGICVKNNGDIFIGDANNFTVRKLSQGTVSIYAGQNGIPGMANGPALQATFNGVSALWYNPVDNGIYLCDPFSQLVRKIASATIQTLTLSSPSLTYCTGASINFTAIPGNLSNYILKDGATTIGNSPNGVFTITGLTTGTHSIYCTATDLSGNTVTSNTLTITISATLTVTIVPSGSTNICTGDSITLGSSVTGTYLWSTGSVSPTITVSNAGTYTLTVTNTQGCSGQSAPLQVIMLSAPIASITSGATLPVCNGDSVMLTAGGATSYQWSNGATTQVTYATAPGNYTVMVTNGAGCSAISLPAIINFYPVTNSAITPSGNIILPTGASAVLTANSGSGYSWSTGSSSQSITVNTQGTYTVTVTDNNGCNSNPASTQVTYVNSSNMVNAGGPLTFCDGDSVVLTSVFPAANQWYMDGNIITGANQTTYIATISGFYQVQHTPVNGSPVFSDSIQVTVRTVPNSVTSTNDTVCKGESAVLSVQPQAGITNHWYDLNAGGTSLSTGLSFSTPAIQQNTSFFVELENSYGCIRPNRFEVIALMHPEGIAEYNSSVPDKNPAGFDVFFTNASTNAVSYLWDFGDGGFQDTVPNPTHTFLLPGDYTVTLYITTADGCTVSINRVLSMVLANNIFIPSGFTPNNDGNNDYFRVRGNNIQYTNISIYNQWGQRIWHSPKEQKGWDGTSGGQYVNNGAYAYAIEVTYENGTTEFYKGNINVIR